MSMDSGTVKTCNIEMRFSQKAAEYKDTLQTFLPFPGIQDKSCFERLPEHIKEKILKEGESFLGYEYPLIRATDFMRFKRTGNRVAFEDVYFAKRHALNGLVLAECMERKGRFLDDIINGIFAICEESAWQLPAHNSYKRSEPQYILADATRPVIDLFAAETGAMLAWVAALLEKELDEVSPFIVRRIQHELAFRIIEPYLTQHFWWMGKDEEPMCNWTVWCTQNVLLTAFSVDFPAEVRRAVFEKAAKSCDYFLKDYGDDGCCDEGAQYYRHAGLCLFGCMNILNRVSDNLFAPLFHWEKVQNIAAYILNVHVDDKYYFNFADCSPVAGRAGVREFLFGKATGQPELMRFAAKDFQADGQLYTDEVNRINLYYRLETLFYYEEVMSFDTSAPIRHKDVYYPSVGLFIVHDGTLSLAVKSGDNDDSHNHNDTGSFTLYKNGKPVFVDIGVESYTQKTFSPRRYEIWTMQSGYHNLPTINGMDEKDGSAYCATNVEVKLEECVPEISMEIATAYPSTMAQPLTTTLLPETTGQKLSTSKLSYVRTIGLDKQTHSVHLHDCTDAEDVILNFITYEKPAIEPLTETASEIISATASMTTCETVCEISSEADTYAGSPICGRISIGKDCIVTYQNATPLAIEVLPITDPRLQKAWDHDLYRIRLRMTGTDFHMTIQ